MAAFVRVTAMALLLASRTVWSSHPFESALDQYEAREDKPQPPRLLNEATDHLPEVHMSHRFDLINKLATGSQRKNPVPDLQVGCADGSIGEKPQKIKHPKKSRRRRSFTPWATRTMQIEPYPSFTLWRAPTYQLSRPYFIPIYGVPGRIPIYFPPQPLYINPGVPHANPPKRPFQGPTYLPPPTQTPPPNAAESTTMTLDNRFNGGGDDKIYFEGQSDADISPPRIPQPPSSGSNNNNNNNVIPTRRPRPSTSTHPPLEHRPSRNNTGSSSSASVNQNEYIPPPPPPQQSRPPQNIAPPAPPAPVGPSSCVWAIISCCSAAGQISYECFEQRGCPGAFWDNSPCDSDFARAAIESALNYYE